MGLFGRKKKVVDTGDPATAGAPDAAPARAEPGGSPSAETEAAPGLFTRPEPLSTQRHAGLGVKRGPNDFGFVRRTQMIPITLAEFAPAATSFPIVFAGDDKVPHVVASARAGESMLVLEDGSLDPTHYTPAYVRRYPFIFGVDEEGTRFVLCIDRASEMVVEGDGEPLFDGEQPTKLVADVMTFMKSMEQQRQATQAWVRRLDELGLFETKTVKAAPRSQDGETTVVARYTAISAAKVKALPADTLASLRENDGLLAVCAHQVSLSNWRRVLLHAAQGAPAPSQ